MDAKTYLALARRPDGSIRPLSEIMASEHNAQFAARTAEILAEREAESKKSETQKRIDQHQRMYDDARHNDDHGRAKMYRSKLDLLREQLASERATEARNKAFASDKRIALIREEADAIARSGHALLPLSSQLDRDNLVAIARSNDYPDPDSQYRDFKELSNRLTDAEIESERVKQSDATIEAARLDATAAQSSIRQATLEIMREKREAVNES